MHAAGHPSISVTGAQGPRSSRRTGGEQRETLPRFNVLLDFSTRPMGGTLNSHLDTLHSDYAFIISTGPIEKGRREEEIVDPTRNPDWGFLVYPNPATDELNLRFMNAAVRDVELYDITGKRLKALSNVNVIEARLPLEGLAMGAYSLRVTTSDGTKSKTVIIH